MKNAAASARSPTKVASLQISKNHPKNAGSQRSYHLRTYAWLTKEIKELRFGSYSHAINYALKHLREELEREKRKG